MNVVIIDYGAGNVFSVATALRRLGVSPVLSSDPATISRADRVVFPGVGQASVAMQRLKSMGLDRVIPRLEMPVLGICLGMQLMCRATEEGNTFGLGIFPLEAKRFPESLKVPHVGWNEIRSLKSALFRGIGDGAWMYFVHSYYIPAGEHCIAVSDYGLPFAAALCKKNFYGCQFHPEKSADAGEKMWKNFINNEQQI